MTIEGGVFLAEPLEVTPGPSPTGSDSLSPLSSHSATPPSIQGEDKLGREAVTHNPRKQTAVARQMQTASDPSRVDCLIIWIE